MTDGRLTLILPWPPSSLSPNARHGHWAQLAKAKRIYRGACAWTARTQGAQRMVATKLHVTLTFVPPSRRAFDLDGCLSRMKSGLDGLADVLGVDDRHWSLTIQREDAVGGFVRAEIEVRE